MKVVLDNTSIAHAGRALYEEKPDLYDIEGLAHLIYAAILSDEIILEGSSRKLNVSSLDQKEGLNALWTWDLHYPKLADIAHITDMFSPVKYEKQINVIAPYVLRYYSSNIDANSLASKIPSVYKSPDYHDFNKFELIEEQSLNSAGGTLTDNEFYCALYTWRGIYYYEFAEEIREVYFPNPRRDQFTRDIKVPGLLRNYNKDALTFLADTLQGSQDKFIKTLNQSREVSEPLYLPPLLSFILDKCKKSREEIVNIVVDVRNSPEAESLRKWLETYVSLASEGDKTDIHGLNKHREEIKKTMRRFEKRYGLEKTSLDVGLILPLSPFLCLKKKFTITLPDFVHTIIKQKASQAFIWRIAESGVVNPIMTKKLKKLNPIPYPEDATQWLVIHTGLEEEIVKSYLPDKVRFKNKEIENEGWRVKTY